MGVQPYTVQTDGLNKTLHFKASSLKWPYEMVWVEHIGVAKSLFRFFCKMLQKPKPSFLLLLYSSTGQEVGAFN